MARPVQIPVPGYPDATQYAMNAFRAHGYSATPVNGSGIAFIADNGSERYGVAVSMRDRRGNNNPEVTYQNKKLNKMLEESAAHGAEAAFFVALVDEGPRVHGCWIPFPDQVRLMGANAYYDPVNHVYTRATLSFKIDDRSQASWVRWI